MKLSRLSLATVAFLLSGCGVMSSIPVHMHTETHIQHFDGRIEHKSSDWEGTLDQLPAQMGKAGAELGAVTETMAKELTEVPPPGRITLKDLSPSLAKYEGNKGVDFLASARDQDGKPISFEYVRLGVKEYDAFFKTAQELYALVYETTQVVGQMRQLATKLLDGSASATADLRGTVDKAIATNGEIELVMRLRAMREVGDSLGTLIPALASKITKLVSTGQALVTSAPTSLTNPKVALHLPLVKDGLLRSIVVVKESGGLMANFAKTLAGFGSA